MNDTIRTTSIKAYNHIRDEGLLGAKQQKVYACLFWTGPLTGRELNKELSLFDQSSAGYHKRLSELETMGVVREVGKRECNITGREVILWDVTDRIPSDPRRTDPEHPKPSPDGIKKAIAVIRGWKIQARLRGELYSHIDAVGGLLDWLENRVVK